MPGGSHSAATFLPQVQEVQPITSYDAAGSFLLLGCSNGSIYYVGEPGPSSYGARGGLEQAPPTNLPYPCLST